MVKEMVLQSMKGFHDAGHCRRFPERGLPSTKVEFLTIV
jgi:hypothetical protein